MPDLSQLRTYISTCFIHRAALITLANEEQMPFLERLQAIQARHSSSFPVRFVGVCPKPMHLVELELTQCRRTSLCQEFGRMLQAAVDKQCFCLLLSCATLLCRQFNAHTVVLGHIIGTQHAVPGSPFAAPVFSGPLSCLQRRIIGPNGACIGSSAIQHSLLRGQKLAPTGVEGQNAMGDASAGDISSRYTFCISLQLDMSTRQPCLVLGVC